MSAQTPIAHDPELPYMVLDPSQRVDARFRVAEVAVSYAQGLGGVAVDTTPKVLPTRAGWYESGEFPLTNHFNTPYQLRPDGAWVNVGGLPISDREMEGLLPLSRLGNVR